MTNARRFCSARNTAAALNLIATRRDWLEATGVYDRGWSKLVSYASWAIVASSAMAVVSLRHPRFLVRWARRRAGSVEYLAHGRKTCCVKRSHR
ncbi:YqjK-like family protein [Shigella flexneri]